MFSEIKTQVQKKFKEISATNQLFFVQVDRDKIWQTYLDAIPEDLRQSNNCNCCKSFLRQYGGIVGIKDNKMITLWDFEVEDPEYKDSVKALKAYISSLPIGGIFLNTFVKCGTDKNPDHVRNLVWQHFYVELPNAFVKSDIGPIQANALGNKDVLKRSLEELTDDAVDTVLELIGQGSLYRGNEFKGMLVEFQKLKAQYKKIKNTVHKDNFCWANSVSTNQAVTRIRNTSIGTLLQDLSEGKELDKAVTAFEKVVAPTNYKRPTALATPKMIEAAKTRLQELGLIGCLSRRLLSDRDLNVNNTLFVDRPSNVELDVFEQIKKDVVVNPKSLSKVEEISINDFVEKVLPTAKSLRVLVENKHLGNFVNLVGPKEESEKTLFKWGNNFSWSYTGQVADSIKERVKAAGGNVDGVLRISLSWDNRDDLDLHLYGPSNEHVYYGSRRGISGAVLDVDANGGDGIRENPVENIYWKELPKVGGEYKVVVTQYIKRESQNQGWTLEVEFNGEVQTFSGKGNGQTGHNHKVFTFNYTKKDGFKITSGDPSEGNYLSKDKWGLKTGVFHKVRAVTFSPNYWSNNIGNKHHIFFLENCVSDEPARGIYNEFLKEELNQDRKVFEMLGSKISVEKTENELAGLGFSDTVRNDIIVEVVGQFKRQLKIKF